MSKQFASAYYAVVAMDFPGFRSVPVEASSDEEALERTKVLAGSGELFSAQGGKSHFDIKWDRASNQRVVAVWRSDANEPLHEGPFGGAIGSHGVGAVESVASLAKELRTDAGADIWYDARQHDDQPAEAVIERLRDNIETAATLLEEQAQLLTSMRDHLIPASAFGGIGSWEFSRHGGWREGAVELVARATSMLGKAESKSPGEAAALPVSSVAETRPVVVRAHSTSDVSDGPLFACFQATPEFLARLERLRDTAAANTLTQLRITEYADWGPGDIDNEMRLQDAELVVCGSGSFWFSDRPKHSDYFIETDPLDLDDLLRRLRESAADVIFMFDEPSLRAMYLEDAADKVGSEP